MFIGEYTYSIDEKKRLAVPPKFRAELKKGAVITRGLDNCLFLYSREEWEKLAEKLSQMPLSRADARGFARIMLSGAMEVDFDNLGRILVPDYLKDYAKLKKKRWWPVYTAVWKFGMKKSGKSTKKNGKRSRRYRREIKRAGSLTN
jgi:mraZ protein